MINQIIVLGLYSGVYTVFYSGVQWCTVVKDQWRGVRCANSAHHHSVSSSGPQPLTTITIINRMGPLSSNILNSDYIYIIVRLSAVW